MSKLAKEITARLVEKETPTKLEKKRFGSLIGNLRALMDDYHSGGHLGSSSVSMREIAKLDVKKFAELVSKKDLKWLAGIIANAKVSMSLLETVTNDMHKWGRILDEFYDRVGHDEEEYKKLKDWY